MQLRAHSSPLLLLPPDSNLAPAPSQQHTRIITVTTINKRLYRFVGREEEIAGGTHFRRYFDLKRKRKSVDRSILLFWLVVVVASRARAEPQNREVRRAVTVLGCSENGQYFYFLSLSTKLNIRISDIGGADIRRRLRICDRYPVDFPHPDIGFSNLHSLQREKYYSQIYQRKIIL